MWVAKIKLFDKNCIHATRAKKFNIRSYEYLLTHYKKGNDYFFVSAHVIVGDEKNKQKYIKDLKKDKHIINLEVHGDLLVELLKKPKKEIDTKGFVVFYHPSIFHPKPVLIDKDGWEYWEISSWDRSSLTKAISIAKKIWQGKLLKMVDTKRYNLFFPKLVPDLTENQKKAINIAIENGYYDFPKKISIEKLARLSGISFSTFREHLRKAERRIIPLTVKDYLI